MKINIHKAWFNPVTSLGYSAGISYEMSADVAALAAAEGVTDDPLAVAALNDAGGKTAVKKAQKAAIEARRPAASKTALASQTALPGSPHLLAASEAKVAELEAGIKKLTAKADKLKTEVATLTDAAALTATDISDTLDLVNASLPDDEPPITDLAGLRDSLTKPAA
ncbi:hypothetical protein [Litorimonas sp. WD9-15]|uniref:hypothetical protein n=1 Tax=Litorimonas sp. WD9-15 TaxID=3418716 RepID=UPI003CFE2B59